MSEKNKNIIKGVAAAPGLAIAVAHKYSKDIEQISDEIIWEVNEAKENLKFALEKSKKELSKIFSLAVDKLGEKRAAIFEAQIMVLNDPILIGNIFDRIEKEKRIPEYIVNDEFSKYQNLMNASKEAYMKDRSRDIEDIKNRIIRNLRRKKWVSKIQENVVVIAESLTPADTMLFSRRNVMGYITDFGGLTSHAAIVARSLNIPAVVGVHDATSKIVDGDTIILDGFHGDIVINPDKEQLNYYHEKIDRLSLYDAELAKLKDEPTITKDGRKITLSGNLELMDEIDLIIQNGAKGIGLVRTEQLFSDVTQFPDEDDQFEIYLQLAEKLYPETVTIRAFDIGGDKVLPVDVKEPNPFLGWRGIRFLLDNQELFETQIRAILRASIHKNVKIMVPMIASIAEIRKTKKIIEECKNELKDEKQKFDENIKFGIMIEIPSAAILAKEFAAEVDFLSIGTNDLIMYLLAVDRGNDIVSSLYQEFHPAVIRSLKYIIQGAEESNANVSLCGEMAADVLATPLLVGLGLDSLSASAAAIPQIKKIIRSLNYSEVQMLANECLELSTEKEIKSHLYRFFRERLTEDSKTLL